MEKLFKATLHLAGAEETDDLQTAGGYTPDIPPEKLTADIKLWSILDQNNWYFFWKNLMLV